jgi:hypothetical protein
MRNLLFFPLFSLASLLSLSSPPNPSFVYEGKLCQGQTLYPMLSTRKLQRKKFYKF